MEEKDKLVKQTKTLLRSILIAAKHGVGIEKINRKNFHFLSLFLFFCRLRSWRTLNFTSLVFKDVLNCN